MRHTGVQRKPHSFRLIVSARNGRDLSQKLLDFKNSGRRGSGQAPPNLQCGAGNALGPGKIESLLSGPWAIQSDPSTKLNQLNWLAW